MRRADEHAQADPLPRLPRDVLALMASVGLRLRQVTVRPPARLARPARRASRRPLARTRGITVAKGWGPGP